MTFPEMVERIRMGDDSVIRSFVAQYEPYLRRSIRRRLVQLKLQAAADSTDICQSALGSFFLRCSAGQFEFESVQQMENLIGVIARRKLARLARREYSSNRDRGLNVSWNSNCAPKTSTQSDPGQKAATKDLMETVYRQLSPLEQRLFEQRRQGENWNQIAEVEGESSLVLRQRLSRALRKIVIGLGLGLD
jgi:DNA-directed RNA polymerase specialized sigma24 family protein